MTFVAIAALNFGAIRALSNNRTPLNNNAIDVLGLGALPMANVLVVGILIGQSRRGSRSFLLGFELFGAAALATHVAWANFFTEQSVMPFLHLVLSPLARTIGQNRPVVHIPIFYTVAAVMLGLPQAAFALIGESLSRKFTIAERPV
jgi:hypothetical protein